MRFISLKTDSSNFSYIEDVFKNLLGSYIKCEKFDDYMVIYNKEFNINELTDTIQALELDLGSPISVYISYENKEELLVNEWELIKILFDKCGNGIYTLKDLLEINRNIDNGIEILKFVLDGTGVDRNVIEGMALNDLNVSKASITLYMHRNTLMYKIDRLYDKTGFDIKTFKDLYKKYYDEYLYNFIICCNHTNLIASRLCNTLCPEGLNMLLNTFAVQGEDGVSYESIYQPLGMLSLCPEQLKLTCYLTASIRYEQNSSNIQVFMIYQQYIRMLTYVNKELVDEAIGILETELCKKLKNNPISSIYPFHNFHEKRNPYEVIPVLISKDLTEITDDLTVFEHKYTRVIRKQIMENIRKEYDKKIPDFIFDDMVDIFEIWFRKQDIESVNTKLLNDYIMYLIKMYAILYNRYDGINKYDGLDEFINSLHNNYRKNITKEKINEIVSIFNRPVEKFNNRKEYMTTLAGLIELSLMDIILKDSDLYVFRDDGGINDIDTMNETFTRESKLIEVNLNTLIDTSLKYELMDIDDVKSDIKIDSEKGAFYTLNTSYEITYEFALPLPTNSTIVVKDSLIIDNDTKTIPDIINDIKIVAVKDCDSEEKEKEYTLSDWNSMLFIKTNMFKAKGGNNDNYMITFKWLLFILLISAIITIIVCIVYLCSSWNNKNNNICCSINMHTIF